MQFNLGSNYYIIELRARAYGNHSDYGLLVVIRSCRSKLRVATKGTLGFCDIWRPYYIKSEQGN
jgi:hypothetical protein